MNKGIYRIAAGVGAVVILVSSCTVQASMVTTNGTPAAVATDSIVNWPAAPAVTSETAVLMDADTGAILYDKGMDEYRYPASTTKLMTLLVAIENSSPKDIVTFTETGVRDVTWDSSNINAQLGESMTSRVFPPGTLSSAEIRTMIGNHGPTFLRTSSSTIRGKRRRFSTEPPNSSVLLL